MTAEPLNLTSHMQIAAAFGVSTRTVREWSSVGMPGGKGCYPLPELIAWVFERRAGDKLGNAEQRSEALEKIREEKLAMMRMERAERAEQLVNAEDVNRAFNLATRLIASAAGSMRSINPEVTEHWHEALNEAEGLMDRELPAIRNGNSWGCPICNTQMPPRITLGELQDLRAGKPEETEDE